MLHQRFYGIALSCKYLGNQSILRYNPAFLTAVDQEWELTNTWILRGVEHAVIFDGFGLLVAIWLIFLPNLLTKVPWKLILDFRATDDAFNGMQFGALFHATFAF